MPDGQGIRTRNFHACSHALIDTSKGINSSCNADTAYGTMPHVEQLVPLSTRFHNHSQDSLLATCGVHCLLGGLCAVSSDRPDGDGQQCDPLSYQLEVTLPVLPYGSQEQNSEFMETSDAIKQSLVTLTATREEQLAEQDQWVQQVRPSSRKHNPATLMDVFRLMHISLNSPVTYIKCRATEQSRCGPKL